jgi:hypothetical protein
MTHFERNPVSTIAHPMLNDKKDSTPARSDLRWGIIVVIMVFLWGVLWHYQGWQTFRLKNHDMIVYHENADRLLQQAALPQLGDVSSYLSVSPPGTSYWIAFGKLAASDPRWQEFLPEMVLFLVELMFAWLLVHAIFGRTVATFSVIGIGISRFGFLGLWPIGHSAYVLGAAFFLLLWARDRREWALAAAIAWFGFGLLVDMAILPAIFLFPIVWLCYRPPWKTWWLVIGVAAVLALWFPYLKWESQNGFRDIVSLITREKVSGMEAASNTARDYCSASLLGESGTWSGAYADWGFADRGSRFAVYDGSGMAARVRSLACRWATNLDRNFDANFFVWGESPFWNSALWILWMSGAVGLALLALRSVPRINGWLDLWGGRHRIALLVCGLATACLWILYYLLQPSILDVLAGIGKSNWKGIGAQALSFFPALILGLLGGLWISSTLRKRAIPGVGVLTAVVWVSWVCLVVLAEQSVELRFWWFWPMQVICIMISVYCIGLSVRQKIRFSPQILSGLACLALVPALFLQMQARRWVQDGYGGVDSGQLALVAELGSRMTHGGLGPVGYQLLVQDYQPLYAKSHDPHHRAGSWFDYLLLSQWELKNPNQSVNGLEQGDRYRIVELLSPCTADQVPTIAPWPGYWQVGWFSCYVIYQSK